MPDICLAQTSRLVEALHTNTAKEISVEESPSPSIESGVAKP
jgi:hypothetical protein